MGKNLSKRKLLDVLNDILYEGGGDGWYGIHVTELDGEPFAIVDGWEDLSQVHDALNARVSPRIWAKWRQAYLDSNTIKRYPDNSPFGGLRLGNVEKGLSFDDPVRQAAYARLLSLGRQHYGTPYYTTPEGLYELGDILEWGFGDEYAACGVCGNAMRTSPDSYAWQLMGDYTDYDGYVCENCVDPEEYIGARINRDRLVNKWLVDPEEHGWVRLGLDYEAGFHHGQNDDPKGIVRTLNKGGVDEVIFTGSVGQFDVAFNVWVREEQAELAHNILSGAAPDETKLPYDIADEMSKVLRGQHSDYYRVESYLITPEDFVAGRFPKAGDDEEE